MALRPKNSLGCGFPHPLNLCFLAFPDPPNLQKALHSDLCSQPVPMVWAGGAQGWFLACLCGTCYSVAQTISGGLGKGHSLRAGACLGLWTHP